MTVLAFLVLLGIKVGGVEFAPRELVWAAADPKSRATDEGPLANDCKWTFIAETRIAKRDEEKGCVRYFYKTTVDLGQSCPAPNEKQVHQSAERITSTGVQCADSSGKLPPPQLEVKVLSSGTTSDGHHQEILTQPDGTRITVLYNDAGVSCSIGFPDGTGDSLKQP